MNFEPLGWILGLEAYFWALRFELGFVGWNLSREVEIEAQWLDFEPQMWILGSNFILKAQIPSSRPRKMYGIWALRLHFGLRSWNLSFEDEIWDSRLNLSLEAGLWALMIKLEPRWWILSLKAEFWALRPTFQLWGWVLTCEAGIRAWRLEFELGSWNWGYMAGFWASSVDSI